MIKELINDARAFIKAYKDQDTIFYFGCAYIIFTYLRPQLIYPQLNFLPWLQLTIVLGLILIAARGQLKFTGTHALVFLFAALAWISALNSYYPVTSMRNIDIPFIWAIEVLFLSNCVRNLYQLKLLMALLFLSLFKMSLFGAKVWVLRGFGFADWGIQGPQGYFQNSGEFSLLMAMAVVMSTPFIVGLNLNRRYLWLLPITATMTVLGASSRGGQLALLIGALYLLLAYKKISIMNIAYIAAAGWLIISIMPNEQMERLSSMGEDQTSTSRLEYWQAGIEMSLDNPWTGVGYSAFPEYYEEHYKQYSESYVTGRKEVSHNSLVQIASTMGIPALIIYLLLHLRVLYRLPRKLLPPGEDTHNQHLISINRSLHAGLITFFVGSFFMSIAFYPYIYLLLGLSIALNSVAKNTS